ncbi:MAG: hypothetical protein WAV04_03465 [Candidatus Microsaccharimonas sp.]
MPEYLFELEQIARRQSWTPEAASAAQTYLDELNCGLEPPHVAGLNPRQINEVESLAQRFLLAA